MGDRKTELIAVGGHSDDVLQVAEPDGGSGGDRIGEILQAACTACGWGADQDEIALRAQQPGAGGE